MPLGELIEQIHALDQTHRIIVGRREHAETEKPIARNLRRDVRCKLHRVAVPRAAKVMLGEPRIVSQFGRDQRLVDRDLKHAFVGLRPILRRNVHGQDHRREIHTAAEIATGAAFPFWGRGAGDRDTGFREARQRMNADAPHPLENRVTPFGTIVASPGRGLMMGNRGVLHDDRQRVLRSSALRRWIACVTEFRGRRRTVMQPRRYTELFFLDEATAFAAGHRPCAECRNRTHVPRRSPDATRWNLRRARCRPMARVGR